MIENYLKTAFRFFKKERVYSILNIVGLSIGLSIGFVSFLYLKHEMSYDQFHSKSDQIYRVHQKFNDGGTTARCSFPIGPALVDEYSQITNMVRFMTAEIGLYVDDEQFIESILISDSTFIDIFDVEWIGGENRRALTEPNDVLITQEVANRLFGDRNPIGKIIRIDALDNAPVVVKGVIKEYPSYSHFKFGILGSLKIVDFITEFGKDWNNPVVWTYITIPNKKSAEEFMNNRFEPFVSKYFPEDIGKGAYLPVIPLSKIHLESHEYHELNGNSSFEYLYGIFGVGILILILASVNYINLSSARALNRLKEIGMRKVLGARKTDLAIQFLFEALILSTIAMIISIALISFFVMKIKSFAFIDLGFDILKNPEVVINLILFTLIVAFITGIYPALVLSSFPTLSIMKGELNGKTKNSWIRQIMVTFQFCIVALFLLGIFIISKQINFVLTKDLGYEKELVARVRFSNSMHENPSQINTFKNNIEQNPNILSVAKCQGLPGGAFTGYSHMKINYEGMPKDEIVGIGAMFGDENFLKTVGLTLLEGRNFDSNLASDSNSVIINETIVRQFGWEGNALGKEIDFIGNRKTKVIGIVKDFHFESLHSEIKPMSIRSDENFWSFAIKIGPSNLAETLNFIEDEWRKFGDNWPLEIQMMEDGLKMQYEAERKILQVFQVMTIIAIILAVIGLLSQVSFTVEKKEKEIGIRKVLGAKISQIFMLLSKETFIEIVIATIIAFPLATLLLNRWLQQFAYSINIESQTYLIALLSIILIAVISVSFTVLKAAFKNPIIVLKRE